MDINLIYSKKDPKQAETRDFVYQYIEDRGILAHIIETDEPVDSPKLIINGLQYTNQCDRTKSAQSTAYPSKSDVAELIEQQIWCV